MKADQLLSHASAIVRDRRRTYGDPAELFEHIARRWSLVLGVPVTPAQTVLCLLDVKLARLTTSLGTPILPSISPATAPCSGRFLTMANPKPRLRADRQARRATEQIRELDPDGKIVVHHRLVDTLGRMLNSGTIDQAMHDAACDFRSSFSIAQLDRLRALPILRVPGTGREPELNERQLDARRRVHEAMEALGGISSPAGSAVWYIVGLQQSVREWSLRQGWGGRPVEQKEAKGILVAALGLLASHYGYSEGERSR